MSKTGKLHLILSIRVRDSDRYGYVTRTTGKESFKTKKPPEKSGRLFARKCVD